MDGVRTMLALVLVTVVVVASAATVASQDADPGVSVLDPMDGTVLPRSKFANTASGATKGKPRLVFDLPDDAALKHTAAGTGGATAPAVTTGVGAGAGADTQDTLEPKPVEVGVSPGAFRATAKRPEEAVAGNVATAPNVATVGKQSQSQSQAQAQVQEDAKKEPATGTGAGAPKQKMFGFADVPRLITAFHFEFVDLMFVWFCFAMLLCVLVVVFLVVKLVKRVKTARQLQVIANPDPDKQD
jgi:hypothetical protein